MTQDRMQSNQFRLTQEFLSDMLGVRRVGVTNAARTLQRSKLISYSRGNITIVDRNGLEAACCSCYAVVKKEFDRLLPYKIPGLPNTTTQPLRAS
jgi:hypothetical protein